ncbi:MAG: hypothetical protein QOD99_1022 [Chthoniobacter sp.]|nr:hypothetical protein [Chthoniobacter sp.]
MAFLNPLLLWGAAAISVPILIHLLMNRKVRSVTWAAMRFLQNAVQRNQHRMNLEDILLLLLRCAVLIFLALALARPALRKAGFNFGGAGGETAVIVLDNSYSMGHSDGVSTRFQKGQIAAEQALDALPIGSSVAVFLISDVVQPVIPEPTSDLNLARKILRDARLCDRGTDAEPALQKALETLGKQTKPRKTVYLITDNQVVEWKNLAEIRKMIDAAKAAQVQTRVVLVGSKEEHNLAITDLRLASALSPVNQPLRFEVEVTNFGVSEATGVEVSLNVDGDPASDQGALDSIAPGAAKRLSLFAKLREPGYHAVTVRMPEDHLPADDHRTVAVRAMKEINMLLVDGNPGVEPRESEVFYLRNALVPVPADEQNEYFLKTKTISSAELESAKLTDFEAVVLVNVVDFSDVTIGALEKYLQRGGGLIVFPGDKINTSFYNEKLAKKFGILPATFGPTRGDAKAQEKFFTLQEKNYQHPIVSLWNDPAAGTLGGAHFYCAFELKPEESKRKEAGASAVVVNYTDGVPAVMERTWGFGRVVQFSSTANTAWNDLAVRPIFEPLIYRTLGSILHRQDEQINISVGRKFTFVCDADLLGKDATIIKPDGKKDAGSLRRIAMVDSLPTLEFDDIATAGAYQVSVAGDAPMRMTFAAQANPAESKLDELPQIDTLAPAAQIVRWTPQTNLRESLIGEQSGTEFWRTFALLALAVACAETVLADIFSKSK